MNELTNRGGYLDTSRRIAGLDIVRTVAILFVIAGHFFLHTPFNSTPFGGASMFLQGMGQTLFMVNVPLFLILTGYLNINKAMSRKYYRGCIRVLLSYLLFSLVAIAVRRYCLHEELSWLQWALKITDFSAIPYGWYIEMWIGLFLLTPFLGAMWRGIASRRHRLVLIATLYLLTALPDFCNRYGVSLMPGYWESAASPLVFFFIGAYIREYQPVVSRWKLCAAIVGLCLINPLFNLVAMRGHTMIHLVGDGNGLVGIPLAAMMTLLFYRVDVKSGALQRISVWSLDMYLVSYCFDALYYPYFREHFFESQAQFGLFFFVVVPLVFLSSFAVAGVKAGLFKLLRLP